MVSSSEFKVGLLVVVVGTIIAVLTLKVSDGPSIFDRQKQYHFIIDNANGLVPNSAVRMAGIKVGRIAAIQLQDGRAKVVVEIDEDLAFSKQGFVRVKPQGLLGDKIVELFPGPVNAEPLQPGSEIVNASDRGSIDDAVGEVGNIAKSISELTDVLSEAATGDGDDTTPIGRIILNLEKMTKDLADVTDENKSKVNEVMDRLAEITKTLDEVINSQDDQGLKYAWGKAVSSLDKLDNTMSNLSEASEKLNNGQGTLGQLINDDEILVKVNSTMDSVNEFLGNANSLETSIGYHAELNTLASTTKSYLNIGIQPGLDRYYLIQIITDPAGVARSDSITIDDGSSTTNQDRTIVNQDALKFNIFFAKNIYNFTIRGGVIENTGGFAVDYFSAPKLRWSLEIYNFDDLIGKAFARYDIYRGFYLLAGADNVLDAENTSPFVGAGLFLTNDDIKLFVQRINL